MNSFIRCLSSETVITTNIISIPDIFIQIMNITMICGIKNKLDVFQWIGFAMILANLIAVSLRLHKQRTPSK